MSVARRFRWYSAVCWMTCLLMLLPAVSPGQAVHGQTTACSQEVEPNNLEAEAEERAGEFCISGELPETADQELVVWTVSEDDAKFVWTVRVDGVAGTVTGAKLFELSSEPGVRPVLAGYMLLDASTDPATSEPLVTQFLIAPGEYLVGISRSDRADLIIPEDTGYEVSFARADRLPKRLDKEPNDDPAAATAIGDAREFAGDLNGSVDVYSWEVDEAAAESGWSMHLISALGASTRLVIRDETGNQVLYINSDKSYRIDLYDLQFAAGIYTLEIGPSYETAAPYRFEIAPADRPVGDVEPNNEPAFASLLDPANPVVKGRLAATEDIDIYRLVVDDQLSGSLLDLRVLTRSSIDRRVCLSSLDLGIDLKCAEGPGGAVISNLLLPEGNYLIRISGTTDPDDQYILRFDLTSAPSPAYETEPNDDLAFATLLDDASVISGTFNPNDIDTFRITVKGDPQLWDVSASGTGIERLNYVRRDGTELATASIASDLTSALLTDLYLTPGDHWIRVYGSDGAYAITFSPMGPPPEDGERETNNTYLTAEPMQVGEDKSGRLPAMEDTDVFRFSLAAREHIEIDLDIPDDGAYRVFLEWGETRLADATSAEAGDDLSFDLTLEPGDYLLYLQTSVPSQERYGLNITRLDPFVTADDQEPNNSIATAQQISLGQTVAGSLDGGDTIDMYMVAAAEDRDLTFSFVGDGIYLALTDEQNNYYSVALTSDGTAYEIDQRVPDEVPLYLQVTGTGPYEITYGERAAEPDEDGGLLPGFLTGGDDDAAPLEIDVALDAEQVAAYWSESQRVSGQLALTNTGEDTLDITLLHATTHFLFAIDVASDPVSVGAGETVAIPFTVEIAPDAWGGIPVRISFGAESVAGLATVFAVITPTADADPVDPAYAWPVPNALLGGLNLASTALGSIPGGTVDPDFEPFLYDGVAPVGSGLSVNSPSLPLSIDIDLAGNDPAPIAGILVNNQSRDGFPQEQIRQFEVQLSTDGVTFETVLAAEAGSLVRDQWFVLDSITDATHARLVILSTYADQPTAPSYVQLGEWGVIAEPGYVPETIDELNIADATLGGFVSRAQPQMSSADLWVPMLTDDDVYQYLSSTDTTTFRWDLSFAETRAAMVDSLRWEDAVDANPDQLVQAVSISISMGTPSGPWEPAGTWNLDRASDGSIEPFQFDPGTWARYIRFEGSFQDGSRTIDLPQYLSVIEAEPSDTYLSVIGTWGQTNAAGPLEWQNPPETTAVSDENDAPDTAEDAVELNLDDTINGRAQIGKDVDWYRVTGPRGDNQLEFTVTGNPTVDVVVRMYSADGDEIAVEREVLGSSATVVYRAPSEPGEEYLIKVEQPPHSIVFTFDTSASMGAYAPMVQQSLRSFADGIEKGQEFVNVMAFTEDPLLESFTDDSYAVYSAINGYYDQSLSSSGETGIKDATELLAGQEGTTAILIITDAETGSYSESEEMWAAMDVTQPRVFGVHVGGSSTPVLNEHLMQNWSSLGGYYQYTTNQSEMDRAFDRAATWLRRPAGYTLTVTSAFAEVATPTPEPTATPAPLGSLAVVSGEPSDSGDETAGAQVSEAVTIEIILDTSGSMLAGMPDGQRRIDVARTVLTDLVTNQLPPGVPVSLRVFGDQPDSCDTSLLVPVQPLDPQAMADTIRAIEPVNLVRTPLGASLEQVASDLAGVSGPKIVVLVTDGEETCDGDPAAAIQSLIDQGIDVQVNIVGFALDDDALRAQFADWARLGNGSYFDATNSEELDEAIARAVQAPYRVLDEDGNQVAAGTVDGTPVELPPGTYTVVVLTDPEQRFEAVVIDSGTAVEIGLDS